MKNAPTPARGLRRGLSDLFSFASLPFEWMGAWPLVQYGLLFQNPKALTGTFQDAISTLVPHRLWGMVAETVGIGIVILTMGALWLQWELYRVRQLMCLSAMLCMGFLSYSSWKTDVPFQVSRIFFYYTGVFLFAAILLGAQMRAAARRGGEA